MSSKDVLTRVREAAHDLGNDPPNGVTLMRALMALHDAGPEIERLRARAERAEEVLGHNTALANKNSRAFQGERDAIIRNLRERYSAMEIADMVGLTRQRVHQILNEPPVTTAEAKP